MLVKNKVVVFDLYDTVLKDISFDFDSGIAHLHRTFFREKCSLAELKSYAESFLPLYNKRKTEHTEVCLIRDEVPWFFEKFGVPKPEDFEELDYDIMNQMQKVTLLDEVKYTLEELGKQGIPMYILSNSIFTGRSAMRLLEDFGISRYFTKLFSSADYKVRKPSSEFFRIVLDEIAKQNPEIKTEEILYLGNDYVTDVIGATSMGLNTVWYNVNHLPNKNGLEITDVDDFREIIKIVRNSMTEVKNSEFYWNNVYADYDRSKVKVDDWLDRFDSIIKNCKSPVLDLGCGGGNDTLYFIRKGKSVIACDQSINAIHHIQKNFPEVLEAKCFNMLDGFAFEDDSFGIVCADLSLHYFTEADTRMILNEIRRVLIPEGHLFVRVNSVNDVNHGAGQGTEIEHHLYRTEDGMLKRFFDEKDVRRVFSDFEILFCEEQKMLRYSSEKNVFCVCLKGKK